MCWLRKPLLAVVAGGLVLAGGITPCLAQPVPPGPEIVGRWTAPFEEGGVETPRCRESGGRIECKPVAQTAAVLPDGRVYYSTAVEGDENVGQSFPAQYAPAARNSEARVLDLRQGVPRWTVPAPADGGGTNPNIRGGWKSTDDPLGMAGVPGRPGDGLVGSAWGTAGGPPHEPWSSPDDPQANDADIFCGDVTFLPDGRLLSAGGTDFYNEPDVLAKDRGDPADAGLIELEGLRLGWLFDPRTDTFTQTEPMKYGRWYPSVVSLADGQVLVASGVFKLAKPTQGSQVRRTETYDPDTNRWTENYADPQSGTRSRCIPDSG